MVTRTRMMSTTVPQLSSFWIVLVYFVYENRHTANPTKLLRTHANGVQ